ncbi:MAG: glycosyl hydrolase [Isosphaeraceae bacterium]
MYRFFLRDLCARILGGWRARRPRREDVQAVLAREGRPPSPFFHGSSKPYTRWWWLAGPFRREDISSQLAWIRSQGFGGVELAWLWPSWIPGAVPGVHWLGEEWADLVAFTKHEADRLGLGCDFTFGSCWPFGGSVVPIEDATRTFDGPSTQRLHGSWEDTDEDNLLILNHLDQGSLRRYAESLLPAFAGGLAGSPSALFCDSLELDTRRLWDPKLWDRFAGRFGYRLEGLEDRIAADPALRHDYRAVIAEAILGEFYEAFAAICREHAAFSRVQCHGAPTDLLAAYAAVDIPESEAILVPPHFSRIAASAAALASRPVVSAETFTCLYGFASRGNLEPYRYWRREQTADLKLLADALFAHGVNHIVWHGMPFSGPGRGVEFYASVHVGPDSAFAADLPAFNAYLERVSAVMKVGRTESRLAVYLPIEENRRLDLIPDEERTPGAVYRWEMRHVAVPRETEGYAPLWISAHFLARAEVAAGTMRVGDCAFQALLVDVEWLTPDALEQVLRLARAGLRVVLRRLPRPPGRNSPADYAIKVRDLRRCSNVHDRLDGAGLTPVVAGDDVPLYWARRTSDSLYLFFAHPKAREVRYPMKYGESSCRDRQVRSIVVDFDGTRHSLDLVFEPYQSLLLSFSRTGAVRFVDVGYRPPEPAHAP